MRAPATLLALALLGSAAAPAATPAPPAVARALAAAGALPGARIEATGYRAPIGCSPIRAEVEKLITGSGSVPVRIEGRGPGGKPCTAVALAETRVFAPVWIASRALAAGEPIEGSAARVEREVRAGRAPLAELPAGAAAARPLAAGTVIEAQLVQDNGWLPGAPVRIVVRAGTLELAQQGRIVSCAPGRACAQLPSGRRVEGRREGSALVLEAL